MEQGLQDERGREAVVASSWTRRSGQEWLPRLALRRPLALRGRQRLIVPLRPHLALDRPSNPSTSTPRPFPSPFLLSIRSPSRRSSPRRRALELSFPPPTLFPPFDDDPTRAATKAKASLGVSCGSRSLPRTFVAKGLLPAAPTLSLCRRLCRPSFQNRHFVLA